LKRDFNQPVLRPGVVAHEQESSLVLAHLGIAAVVELQADRSALGLQLGLGGKRIQPLHIGGHFVENDLPEHIQPDIAAAPFRAAAVAGPVVEASAVIGLALQNLRGVAGLEEDCRVAVGGLCQVVVIGFDRQLVADIEFDVLRAGRRVLGR